MTKDQYIEKYLKDKFLNTKDPLQPNHKPTEEDWNRMPPEHKKFIMDLFGEMPIIKEAFKLYELKHTDMAFGAIMKSKIKELLR